MSQQVIVLVLIDENTKNTTFKDLKEGLLIGTIRNEPSLSFCYLSLLYNNDVSLTNHSQSSEKL